MKIQQSLASCLLLLVAATRHNVVAEDHTPGPNEIHTPPPFVDEVALCRGMNSCTDCLEAGFCDWYGSICSHNTLQIADVARYSVEPQSTVEEVCQRATLDRQDLLLCDSKTDCASCTETILSDSINSCTWYPEFGFCGSELCGQIGCGLSVCEGTMNPILTTMPPLPP